MGYFEKKLGAVSLSIFLSLIIIIITLLSLSVNAYDFDPGRNITLQNEYSIINGVGAYFDYFYGDGRFLSNVNGTLGDLGACANEQVVKYNTTSGDWYCSDVALAGAGDIDAVNTAGDYLTGGQTTGTVSLLLNESKLNSTISAMDTNTQLSGSDVVSMVGNYSAWDKDYDDLINKPSITGDNTSWNETYADTLYAGIGSTGGNLSFNQTLTDSLYVDASGDTMTDDLNMTFNNIWEVNRTSTNYICSADGNSIYVQPSCDVDDFFSFKTVLDRPTIKREGGKYIYFESSNVYDVGISFRADDTYSGTLNYEKDNYMMTMLGKNSPLGFKANSDYDNYIMIETYNNQPQISVWNGTILKINDSLEVLGYIYDTNGLIVTDNSSWNKTYADTLYAGIGTTGGNLSFNQTLTDTLYADISVVDTNTWWSIITGYFYNNSGSLDLNETKLNATIDDRDSDLLNDVGACGNEQVIKYNTSSGEWYCSDVALAGAGDIDAVNTAGDYLTGGQTSGSVNLLLDETKLNSTISALDTDTQLSGSEVVAMVGNYSADQVSIANWNKTYADTLYADISVTDTNTWWAYTGYLYNNSGNLDVNETKLNATISDLASDGGNASFNQTLTDNLYAGINDTGELSYYYNKTSATYTANLSAGGYVGYKAGNYICDQAFTGTHLCYQSEVILTIQNNNISEMSQWSDTAWIITGGPKYSPADLPVNDCNSFRHGTSDSYLGSFWMFDDTHGGVGGVGHCANSLPLACCKEGGFV